MNSLEIRNRKIIDAVIRKEQAVCPGAIALIGIYGSFQTGDIHPLSDLDLLILINDDRGWQLGKAFIQEDLGVGHDIYCTTRESLRQDAEYDHPHRRPVASHIFTDFFSHTRLGRKEIGAGIIPAPKLLYCLNSGFYPHRKI